MNISSINSKNTFDALAHKLRMQKFDKNQILHYKNEAINGEKLKNKRKKAVLNIQRFSRGYIVRKKFRAIMEDINKNIIIEYFREKRKQRIRENYKQIILRNLDNYLDRQREVKRKLLFKYFCYCATKISKTFRGYKTKKTFTPLIRKTKFCKEKISGLVNSYKTRAILRTNKVQDILVEVANIQNCLSRLNTDDRNSNKTEKLRTEFTKRLPKLLLNFYEEFYKIKRSRFWVNCIRTDKPWMDKFISVMTQGVIRNVFTENPQILTEIDTTNNMNNMNNFNNLNNDNVINSSQDVRMNNLYKSNDKSNENINANNNQNINSAGKVNEPTINNKPNAENENANYNQTLPNQTPPDQNNQNTLDYDNKPIKVNNKNGYDLSKFEEFAPEEVEVPSAATKNKKSPLKRKAPKYDARKAIKEAEKETTDTEKNKERGAFRKFLREMREQDKEKENNEMPNMTPNKKEKTEIKDVSKNKKIENMGYKTKKEASQSVEFGGGLAGGSTNLSEINANNKEDNTRRNKVVTTEINLRKKLHELEKSPPPRIDVTKIKSKIDCWGSENEPVNTKKFKRIDDFDKPSINFSDTKPKENFMSNIDQDFRNIEATFNIKHYLKTKIDNMKEFSSIPYIKQDSFYIRHYSNEIYEQLLLHLNKHYDELKN